MSNAKSTIKKDAFLTWCRQNKELFRLFLNKSHEIGLEPSTEEIAELIVHMWNSTSVPSHLHSLDRSVKAQFRNQEQYIFAKATDGKCLVKLGDGSFVQSMSGSRRALEISQEECKRYESLTTRFWKAVAERSKDGSLDLSNLEEDSPLEACFILGILRGNRWPMSDLKNSQAASADIMIEVPLLGTSLTVQSMIESERTYFKAQIAHLQSKLNLIQTSQQHMIPEE